MTRTHQKRVWKTSKNKENGWQTLSCQQVFLTKSGRKVPRVQKSKKCGWCRGCRTVKKKRMLFREAVLRACADSSILPREKDIRSPLDNTSNEVPKLQVEESTSFWTNCGQRAPNAHRADNERSVDLLLHLGLVPSRNKHTKISPTAQTHEY